MCASSGMFGHTSLEFKGDCRVLPYLCPASTLFAASNLTKEMNGAKMVKIHFPSEPRDFGSKQR